MVITFNKFYFIFFVVSLSILVFMRPIKVDLKKLDEIPQLEFSSFAAFEMEQEKLKIMLTGEEAKRFNTYYLVSNFALYQESNETIKMVSALEGRYEESSITLSREVQYSGEDDLFIYAEKALYNLRAEMLDVRSAFKMIQNENVIEGDSLFFNQRKGTINASNIQVSIELDPVE